MFGRSSSHVHDDNLIFCERSEQSTTQTMQGEREEKEEEEGRKERKNSERFKPICILVPFSLTVVVGMYDDE